MKFEDPGSTGRNSNVMELDFSIASVVRVCTEATACITAFMLDSPLSRDHDPLFLGGMAGSVITKKTVLVISIGNEPFLR